MFIDWREQLRKHWGNFTDDCRIFWNDVVPGIGWFVTITSVLGVMVVLAWNGLNAMQANHTGPVRSELPVSTSATMPLVDHSPMTVPALQADGYSAGSVDTFAAQTSYSGMMWQTRATGKPVVVLFADGPHKGLVAQVRAFDGSFWCSTPTQYQSKHADAVAIFERMAAKYQQLFAIGETLRFDIEIDNDILKVVCGRA